MVQGQKRRGVGAHGRCAGLCGGRFAEVLRLSHGYHDGSERSGRALGTDKFAYSRVDSLCEGMACAAGRTVAGPVWLSGARLERSDTDRAGEVC